MTTLSESKLRELKEIAEKATPVDEYVVGCNHCNAVRADFNRHFTPAVANQLTEELLRLREQQKIGNKVPMTRLGIK
jgi:hypothetical protein